MEFRKEYLKGQEIITEVRKYLINGGLQNDSIISSKDRDIKIELDIHVEKIIIEKIQSFSNYKIISEEMNNPVEITAVHEPCWIIDPIDGSFNFINSIPTYSCCLAFWDNGSPIFGIVLDIPRDITYTGYVDADDFKANGKSVNLKENLLSIEKENSVLATGIPTYLDLTSTNINLFGKLITEYKKIRMFGCASLSLVMCAEGKVDSYYESNIKIWDVAAGIVFNKIVNKNITIKYLGNNLLDLKTGK
jgi:myo-inositol-1(or 4)-monophosphatase